MTRKIVAICVCALVSVVLLPAHGSGQSAKPVASSVGCPGGTPGVYVQDTSDWHLLSQTAPSKTKAKHAYLSSLSYGAIGVPMVVEYAGPHAVVQVHATRPAICIAHFISPNPAMLVRLKEKKKIRELDSGTIRAVPVVGGTRQAQAEAGSVVPTTTEKPEDGVVFIRPQADLAPGEYAVMFGAQNLAILDFGVTAAH